MTNFVDDKTLVESIFDRVSTDLAMIIDRTFAIGSVDATRESTRTAGQDDIHISFKLGFKHGDETHHGCVLMPLPDAISVASYLMMMPDEDVQARRGRKDLDSSMKDAMLEVGNFVAGASDAIVRNWIEGCSVRSEGCQGVRAGVRPAFQYEEGDELIVGRATGTVHDYDDFELILMLPAALSQETAAA